MSSNYNMTLFGAQLKQTRKHNENLGNLNIKDIKKLLLNFLDLIMVLRFF